LPFKTYQLPHSTRELTTHYLSTTSIAHNTMAYQKVNKAIAALVDEACRSVVDKLYAKLESQIEMDDDIKKIFEDMKTETAWSSLVPTKVPKGKKGKSDSDSEVEKKKRAPTEYNLFMKEKIALVKKENPELSGKDCLKRATELWKKQKTTASDDE